MSVANWCAIAVCAMAFLVVIVLWIWDARRPASSTTVSNSLDQVRCTTCGETVPRWFSEPIAQTGETICLKHIDGMPYPLPAETEDDFIARWIRDGKPRAAP